LNVGMTVEVFLHSKMKLIQIDTNLQFCLTLFVNHGIIIWL